MRCESTPQKHPHIAFARMMRQQWHMADTQSLPETELSAQMLQMGAHARRASQILALGEAEDRTRGLEAMALGIEDARELILTENARDLELGREKGLEAALMDRLALDAGRIDSMVSGLKAVAQLPDPVGRELARWTRPNGLDIARIAGPLGVIGIIYESRPNVTADAAALCLRSANAAILRCGSESLNSSIAIANAMRAALADENLPEDAVQLVQTRNRAAVGHMLAGLGAQMDVVVPRGGKGLVARVQSEARIPVIGHLEGLCHIYVDAAADPAKAVEVVVNAKMRRVGICGALETLLVDKAVAGELLPQICNGLTAAGCDLRGDEAARALVLEMEPASEEDWRTEYLAPVLSVRVVDGLNGALEHIRTYSSGHTDAIITEDQAAADRFTREVDSAIVMVNASTQFADGGEFGMGAEIGIATGRIHARGPVGAEQLTIFKYVVRGTGQVRP